MRDPDVDVRAVTVVAGNVPLDLAVRNAIVTLDICGGPRSRVRRAAIGRCNDRSTRRSGCTDRTGWAERRFPNRRAGRDTGDAVSVLLDIAASEPGRHDLVTLGPLTNIASALERDPAFLTRFGHTYLMAGSPDGVGNVDALGEYNVWADPEAAAIVFAAPGRRR